MGWLKLHCHAPLQPCTAWPEAPAGLPQVQPAFKDMDDFLEGSVDGFPSLASLDAEGAGLRESQDLFELYVSDYVTLARCRVSRGCIGAA